MLITIPEAMGKWNETFSLFIWMSPGSFPRKGIPSK